MSTRPRYLLLPLIAAVVMVAIAGSSAQQSPAQTDPPTFRITTDFVQVDVIATDGDDRPVSDLLETDFEVLEDGKAQAIQQFKLVRLDSGPADSEALPAIRSRYDEEREAARDDVRLFGIFFDHRVSEVEAKRVRDPLIQFVRTRLRPLDMVATMHSDTPLVAVEFTRDRDVTVRAIERYADELRQRQEREARERLNNPSIPSDPRRSINGLHALASRMADLRDGRKSIIYVGRGVADAFSSRMNGGAFDFDELTTNLNRSNTSVYVLDPGGLTGRSMTGQASLRGLAYETGGLPIVGTNNFAGGLMRVSLDAGMYYLLGYTSSAPADGKFHEIKVRIRRNGVNVRARSGYWAVSAESLKRMATPGRWAGSAVMEALGSLTPSAGLGYARTWVGFARGSDGRGEVTVAWEPRAGTPGESRERVTAVSLDAVDAKGSVSGIGPRF